MCSFDGANGETGLKMAKNLTIALIGCSKRKHAIRGYTRARDLYDSDLFTKRVKHVEDRKIPWYILSAKSGLLKPTTLVRTYDQVLMQMPEIEVAEWHVGVVNQVFTELYYDFKSPNLEDVTIELHAGKYYCEPLATILGIFGIEVVRPVEGLGIGQQLAYYSQKKEMTT